MADNRTMAQMLQAPTEGYEDAIVVPAITTANFELKAKLLLLFNINLEMDMTKSDPHAHVPKYFTDHFYDEVPNSPDTRLILCFSPFSLEGQP
ncbi:hypothetical protein Tco_1457668 [Tanacetum coccineum]